MRYTKLFLFIFAAAVMLPVSSLGQKLPPPGDPPLDGAPENRRPNLLAALGLSPEQVQQVRQMNQERQPLIRQARMRMGEAQRNLDMAIYGDSIISDSEFQVRLKEFQAAEAELARLRFESELAVRRILTPEQLVRFREIRRRFAERRQGDQPGRRGPRRGERMRPPGDDPLKRPGN